MLGNPDQVHLAQRWREGVQEGDLVLLLGDITGVRSKKEALYWLQFLDPLPGRKVILPGNHDPWYIHRDELQEELDRDRLLLWPELCQESLTWGDLRILLFTGMAAPAVRSSDRVWGRYREFVENVDQALQHVRSDFDGRLVLAFHYPPYGPSYGPSLLTGLSERYGVDDVLFGHLHGQDAYEVPQGVIEGTRYLFVGADYRHFQPVLVAETESPEESLRDGSNSLEEGLFHVRF